jgi:N-acetylmuramoyl-L-alanine amidase
MTAPATNRRIRQRVALVLLAVVLLGLATGAIANRNRGASSRSSAIVTPTTSTPRPSVLSTTTAPPTTAPPTTASTTPAPTTTASTTPATDAATVAPTAPQSVPSTVAPAVLGSGSLAALRGRTITIDPGHNGGNYAHTAEISRPVFIGTQTRACDTTGTATNDGYSEAAYTLDVALRLRAVLRAAGANVVMTRTTNDGWGPCIDQRAAIGNNANSAAAISIHADGGPANGRGFHVLMPGLVPGYTDDIYSSSHRLGVAVRDAFVATGMPTSTYYASQGLVERTDLGGLNLSNVPKVFVETGNMRNATDAALLESADFRRRAAQELAVGLDRFLAS